MAIRGSFVVAAVFGLIGCSSPSASSPGGFASRHSDQPVWAGHVTSIPRIVLTESEERSLSEARLKWDQEQESRLQAVIADPPPDVDVNLLIETARWRIEGRKEETERVDTQARHWPQPESTMTLGTPVDDHELDGSWVKGWRGGESMDIRQVESDLLAVRFCTWGCMGFSELDRAGRIRDGMLVLDKPVHGYSSDTLYNVIFIVRRSNEGLVLVPFPLVNDFAQAGPEEENRLHHLDRFTRSKDE